MGSHVTDVLEVGGATSSFSLIPAATSFSADSTWISSSVIENDDTKSNVSWLENPRG